MLFRDDPNITETPHTQFHSIFAMLNRQGRIGHDSFLVDNSEGPEMTNPRQNEKLLYELIQADG